MSSKSNQPLYFHSFDLGHAKPKIYAGHVFQKGQLVSTRIIRGVSEGRWVKARVVAVDIIERTLDLEVLDYDKWNLKKIARGVPFSLVDPNGNKALQDEHVLLSLRVDQLVKQVGKLRQRRIKAKKSQEKIKRRDETINYQKKKLNELKDELSTMERLLLSNGASENLKELIKKDSNQDGEELQRYDQWKKPVGALSAASLEKKTAELGNNTKIVQPQRTKTFLLKTERKQPSSLTRRPLHEIEKENVTIKVDLFKVLEENLRLRNICQDLQKKIVAKDYESGASKILISKMENELMELRLRQRLVASNAIPREPSFGKARSIRLPKILIPSLKKPGRKRAVSVDHYLNGEHNQGGIEGFPFLPRMDISPTQIHTNRPRRPNWPTSLPPNSDSFTTTRDRRYQQSEPGSYIGLSSIQSEGTPHSPFSFIQSYSNYSRSKNSTQRGCALRPYIHQLLKASLTTHPPSVTTESELEEKTVNSRSEKLSKIVEPSIDTVQHSQKTSKEKKKPNTVNGPRFSKSPLKEVNDSAPPSILDTIQSSRPSKRQSRTALIRKRNKINAGEDKKTQSKFKLV